MHPRPALKHGMPPVSIERTFAMLTRRMKQLHAELSEQAEEIAARLNHGKAVNARVLARHDHKRDRFWSLKCRDEQLRARYPAPPVATDDF